MCRAANRAAARRTTSSRSSAENVAQGIAPLLHHRRQFRAQQGLGTDPRPADPAARKEKASTCGSSSRSIRCATSCRTSSRSAKRAGVTRVFIGLENINPDNLLAAKKRQNKITEYRKMLLAWKKAGIITYAVTSSASRTTRRNRSCGHRDHEEGIAARYPGVLFPDAAAGLGGSQGAVQERGPMDPDMNKYDLEHVCHHAPEMTPKEWDGIYQEAWTLLHAGAHERRSCVAPLPAAWGCRGCSRYCSSSRPASRWRASTRFRAACSVSNIGVTGAPPYRSSRYRSSILCGYVQGPGLRHPLRPGAQAERAARGHPAAHGRARPRLHRRARRAGPRGPQPGGRARGDGRAQLRARHRPGALARQALPHRPQRPARAALRPGPALRRRQPARRLLDGRHVLGSGTGKAYDGYVHFDYKPPRSEDIEGVWETARACMRNYLILRDKAHAFRADPEVAEALEAAKVAELAVRPGRGGVAGPAAERPRSGRPGRPGPAVRAAGPARHGAPARRPLRKDPLPPPLARSRRAPAGGRQQAEPWKHGAVASTSASAGALLRHVRTGRARAAPTSWRSPGPRATP